MSSDRATGGSDLTNTLWDRFGQLTRDDIPDVVATVAGQCMLDWFGCALVGSREPLAEILREEFGADNGPCSLVGSPQRCDPLRAAMVNGAAGHALDFDDTSGAMGGHPTVPLLPAVLALAEQAGRSGSDVLTAYVVGMEVQARIGWGIGPEHYRKGWHQTATVGVFGAAAAASWLLGLDAAQFGNAMGIAASNASGLKANFGTMTKPLHPGQAAERGVLAARLASRGFTANAAAIDGNQGLAQAAGSGQLAHGVIERKADDWATERILFKFHAACHLTHAGIDATSTVLRRGVAPEEVEAVTLTVNPAILDVCGIVDPTSGLEAKFSLRGTQALLLCGFDTAAIDTFSDGPITSAPVRDRLDAITIATDEGVTTMRTIASVSVGGETHQIDVDVSKPSTDLELQGAKLRAKFDALAGPVLGSERAEALGDTLERIDDVRSIVDIFELAGSC